MDTLRALLPPRPAGDFLKVSGGPEDGRVLALTAGETRLGSAEKADIPLILDAGIEPVHCLLSRDTDLHLVDLSQSGTFLNGARVGARTVLADGDEVRMGATVLRVSLGVREDARVARGVGGSTTR